MARMRSKATGQIGKPTGTGTGSGGTTPFSLLGDIRWADAFWASDPGQPSQANGSNVSAWRDGSANGVSFTEYSVGYPPVLATALAGLNSKPAVTIDSGHGLATNYVFTPTVPFSFVAVFYPTAKPASGRAKVLSLEPSSGPAVLGFNSAGKVTLEAGGTTLTATGTADLTNTAVLAVGVVNGASSKLQVNTLATVTGAVGTWSPPSSAGFQIGTYDAQNLTGSVAFGALYLGDITAHAQYTNLRGWVGSFYGVSTGAGAVSGNGAGSTPTDSTAPTVPTSPLATASASQVNLSWTASTDAVGVAGYRVYRNGSAIPIGSPSGTSYTDTAVSPGTTYTYRIAAYDAAGNVSAQSSSVSATTTASADTTAPSTPTGLVATAASASVTLTWTASTDASGISGYRVYRFGTIVGSPGSNSYTDPTVNPTTTYSYTVAAVDNAGNISGQSAPVSVTTLAATGSSGGGTRDPFYWPFSSDGVWNLPIGSGAVYESPTATKTVHFRTADVQPWLNCEQYSHPVYRAAYSDPVVYMTDTGHPEQSRNIYLPASAAAAPGSDAHCHVLQPDGRELVEMWIFNRGARTCARLETCNVYEEGIGPQHGTRAYGGSAIGGLIRRWEVDPTDPRYTDGVIRHALALAIPYWMLYYAHDGSWSGYDAAGYGTAHGYVWPATEQDYGSEGNYSGLIPMGQYFAIPKTTNVASLGLSPAGYACAKALQDYGGYVTDQAYAWALYAEPSLIGSTFLKQLLNEGYWDAKDIKTIRANCVLVTNNSPSSRNGGGTRPIALAPALR